MDRPHKTVLTSSPTTTQEHLDREREPRATAAKANASAATERRATAHDLYADGLAVHEIDAILHVLHQRATQLLEA